jgi:hypothetical protein
MIKIKKLGKKWGLIYGYTTIKSYKRGEYKITGFIPVLKIKDIRGSIYCW